MTDGEKERIRYRAAALDRASTACLAIGVFSPITAALYGAGSATAWLVIGPLVWLALAGVLHWLGYRELARIG